MGQAPYDDPDALDLMRADADQVELVPVLSRAATSNPGVSPDPEAGFDVPSDAVDLGAALHIHLD
jgi:hypothetical protein